VPCGPAKPDRLFHQDNVWLRTHCGGSLGLASSKYGADCRVPSAPVRVQHGAIASRPLHSSLTAERLRERDRITGATEALGGHQRGLLGIGIRAALAAFTRSFSIQDSASALVRNPRLISVRPLWKVISTANALGPSGMIWNCSTSLVWHGTTGLAGRTFRMGPIFTSHTQPMR
jgi:hypothetical protein